MTSESLVVFIVDDDEDVRIALSRSLSKRGMRVEHFADAQAFLNQVHEDAKGCLILDYGMPGMDGLELQDHLNRQGSTIPVIFISGHGGIPESVRATKAGAIDFLEKPFDLAVLIERIQAAFEVGAQLRSDKARRKMLADKRGLLTEREEQVLQHILTHPARTSSKEIAAELGISPRTVEIHRGRIQQKVGVKTTIELYELFGQMQ
ncbi:LuxR family transcriptional regulator [Ruegeria sp. ANG-R]|uniref:response regulator transcription factor n=1 Tax=Ruegeria sp. ANG-R TaxID=1577903 RepID=UPI00057D5A06|nr:response regulator [Ruegeria sp. ANG-R]KIC38489.1 LuxR family transcriptional regulator [Ruegeria sp. ANG-R]